MKTCKSLVFLPGDVANVSVHFKCKMTTILRIEAIEIEQPDNKDVLLELDL